MRKIWGSGGAGGLGINDALLQDRRLSFPARGLAVHLLLLPESARPDPVVLAARPGETAESIEGYLVELESAGYLRRRTVRGDADGLIVEVTVYAQARAGAGRDEEPGRVFRWPL
ncbi:hypothetical protein [Yinghuangia sp. YIM S10712]|uniref:hypothetical protein n=1 Tax=Yinghuangia sp. YIM S10712 TaxID=3436930 RepID=UPI003F53C9F2